MFDLLSTAISPLPLPVINYRLQINLIRGYLFSAICRARWDQRGDTNGITLHPKDSANVVSSCRITINWAIICSQRLRLGSYMDRAITV